MSLPVAKWINEAATPSNIVLTLFAVFSGYLSYQHFRDSTDERLEKVESALYGRKTFMIKAGNRIDHMCERMDSCERRFGPLDVPD